jgi:hypothetical protein
MRQEAALSRHKSNTRLFLADRDFPAAPNNGIVRTAGAIRNSGLGVRTMKKIFMGAAAAAIGLAAMTAVASAQVCVLGIFGAAIYVAAKEKRELTQKEAMTCGVSYMFDDKKDEPKDAKGKKTAKAKTAKKKD